MPPDENIIKVAIIEDQQVLREGLSFLLDGTDGFRCTGSFGSVEQALRRISDDLPQVALVDIGLPGMSGIEGIRIMKGRWPDLLLITLTVYEDDQKIFDALCAGALGYLLKRTSPAQLVDSLKEVVNGARRMSKGRKPIRENTVFVPRSPDDDMLKWIKNPEAIRRLKATGILNEDGSVNMVTVQDLDVYKRERRQQ